MTQNIMGLNRAEFNSCLPFAGTLKPRRNRSRVIPHVEERLEKSGSVLAKPARLSNDHRKNYDNYLDPRPRWMSRRELAAAG
jgi:hypothetical protein